MHWWFQNMKENRRGHRRLAFFRGSFGSSWERQWLKYEFATGPNLRLEIGDDGEGEALQLSFGFFVAAIYLTFPWIKVPKSMRGRHWGFYVFEWTFVFFWGGKVMESSSKDPWYYSLHLNLFDLLFGRSVHFENERMDSYGPRFFEYRGKRYCMNDIKLTLGHWFRSRVPFSLYCKKVMRMNLKIDHPPMHAGKGENDWDCGDDGSYGMCAPYDGPALSHDNREDVFAHCCLRYCESAARDTKKYGTAEGDNQPVNVFGFKYLGAMKDPTP